ncbi:PTS lactose/cellobiose transporter subunit IIA [Tepidimicrobium xylanilyticum]|uniref:PTS lactose/cellobiose transporter subunit IIA n=1 Tax=Tepidimicrobium xylanilyticum TaxID=1123352 RepID=UPI0026560511|nr:PTS lactose/cellobiose transporter subunit IIA [Tepidimicrobium xylanilyticum]GMG95695.1 PTS mannose transporter subunit IIA [Tepidimicrobium xylanilyticum]
MNELERLAFELISNSGSARSYAFEALKLAKEGELDQANEKIAVAREEILKAHKIQTQLIQKEANGDKIEINILFVHAQDHLMTSILAIDLIRELIYMQEEINKCKKSEEV